MKETIKEKTVKKFRSNITVTIIAGTIVMLLLFGVIAILIGYMGFSQEFTGEYSENAVRIANAAADIVNSDELDRYLSEKGSSEEYKAQYKAMENLCNKVNARFIYVIQTSEDYRKITYIFNTVNENSGFTPYEIGLVKDTTNDEYAEKYRRLYEEGSKEEIVVRDKGFIESGSHITAMIPLYKSSGEVAGILCVQRQMDVLETARNRYLRTMLIVVIVLALLVTGLYGFYLSRAFIKPIRVITNETMRFAANPSPAEQVLSEKIKRSNEIGLLAASVDKMETDTLDYIENLTKATAERQRVAADMELAASIQRGMLNSVSPERAEIDIFAAMDPAREVGGDFYDYFMLDEDHLCMVVADVSGKGVPASLFMAITKVLINDTTMVTRSPAEILRLVNTRICSSNKLDMFVTVWVGIMELSTGKVVAANAGHEYPMIYRSGGRFELMYDKHGFVVGGMSGMKYMEYDFVLKKGDSLFLYTDGAPEATDINEQLFGTDRMLEALNKAPASKPQELIQNVRESIDEFVGEAPQFDDLTMMCLKYYGKDVE